MKAAALGWGVAGRGPCAAAAVAAATLPGTLLRRAKAAARCSMSSLPSSVASSRTSSDHISFIEDVAATKPPEYLDCLLNMLQTRGETIVPPGARQGLIPLVVPLSRSPSGVLTALLRWPTSPPGMEMPVVEAHKYGVWLLAKNMAPRKAISEDIGWQHREMLTQFQVQVLWLYRQRGGVSRLKKHLAGGRIAGYHNVQGCKQVPPEVKKLMVDHLKAIRVESAWKKAYKELNEWIIAGREHE